MTLQSQLDPQNLSNTVWAMATISLRDQPLLSAIARQATLKIKHFTAQPLSNTIWAFATMHLRDAPLSEAIS